MRRRLTASITAALLVLAGLLAATPANAAAWPYVDRYGYSQCYLSKYPTTQSYGQGSVVHQIGSGGAGGYYEVQYNNGSAYVVRTFTSRHSQYAPWATLGYTVAAHQTAWFCKN